MDADDLLPEDWLESAVRDAKAVVAAWPAWKRAAYRVEDSYEAAYDAAYVRECRILIEAALEAITDPQTKIVAKLSWKEGNEISRQSALIISMAGGLGLSDEDLDGMFIAAAALEV